MANAKEKPMLTPVAEGVRRALAEDSGRGPKRPAIRVLQAMMGEPWLILPDRLEQLAQIAMRFNDSADAVSAQLGRPLDNTRSVTLRKGVAVVPLTGPIVRYADFFSEVSGLTAIESFAADFGAADADPQVQAIVLEVDSPGGMSAGLADAATIIRNASKPVIAYVDNQAASAAYWLAAAADEVVISRAAMLGSVGVIVTLDVRKRDGVVEIVSKQSPDKRPDMSTEAGRGVVQELTDDLAGVFVSDVAELRGIEESTVLEWRGGMLVGQKAIDAGMADRLGDLESLIAELNGVTTRGTQMASKASADTPEITRDFISEHHPAVAAQLRAEGAAEISSNTEAVLALPVVAEGVKNAVAGAEASAAAAERERIKAVEAQGAALPGFESLIAELKYDGKTTGPEAAVALLAANSERLEKTKSTMRSEVPPPLAAVAGEEAFESVEDDGTPLAERCEAQWRKSAELRGEFGSLDAFVAYTQAEQAGRVRRIGGKQ